MIASLSWKQTRGQPVAAAPALDSSAVLLSFRRLQRCADLHAGVVAIFLLQRALRIGTAPAFAVFVALAFYFAAQPVQHRGYKFGAAAAVLIFVATSYASIWSAPVSFSEAAINSRARISLERELADFVKALPPDSTLLMYLGNHVGALQQAGIPLRRVINEGNHRTWKQPVDLDGLWERALANPAKYADFVIAFEGDAVSSARATTGPGSSRGDSRFGRAQGDDLPRLGPCPVIICVNLPPGKPSRKASFPVIKSSHRAPSCRFIQHIHEVLQQRDVRRREYSCCA